MLQNALPAVGLLVLMVLLAWALQRWKKHLPGAAAPAGPALKVLNAVVSSGLPSTERISRSSRSR